MRSQYTRPLRMEPLKTSPGMLLQYSDHKTQGKARNLTVPGLLWLTQLSPAQSAQHLALTGNQTM